MKATLSTRSFCFVTLIAVTLLFSIQASSKAWTFRNSFGLNERGAGFPDVRRGALASTISVEDVFLVKFNIPFLNKFIVINTNDGGSGSLRQAILDANATANINAATPDTIFFNIPGGGPHTIAPLTALPTITDPVVIDGYTQTGSAKNTLLIGNDAVLRIVLNGNNVPAADRINGFTITAGNTTLQGLVINGFRGFGILYQINAGNIVCGNYIGTDVSGTVAVGNDGAGISLSGSSSNTIGGTTAGERNVISGNGAGIIINSSSDNIISGNYIGTNASGTAAIGNTVFGININSPTNKIGGSSAGERNVISGNTVGIRIDGADNIVTGNYIGTDVTGFIDLGNRSEGMEIDGSGNRIGGSAVVERNIISGNGENGIRINPGATNNRVLGNYIGTDLTGTADLGNRVAGVHISNTSANIIGGSGAGEGNVIAGNGGDGVFIRLAAATGNLVKGNYIGTNASGTGALGNGQSGVHILNAPANTIGGITAGEGNIISGNENIGIFLEGGSCANNLVKGNYIGTDTSGTIDLGNKSRGILIFTALNNTIGSTEPNSGNTIAFNKEQGIAVLSTTTIGNAINQNSIFANLGLGIDLGTTGITPNDGGDGDEDANKLQNFPDIALAQLQGNGNLGVTYTVPSAVTNSAYPLRIEFFKAHDGEGKTFLGVQNYTAANAALAVTQIFTLAVAVKAGDTIVATATDALGNTSEFSSEALVLALTAPAELTIDNITQNELNSGTSIFTFTVSLSAPAGAGGVTFDIATADGTAQDKNPVSEDNDYVQKSLTSQTIPAGSSTFTFDVTVNGDNRGEPNETFFVNVTNVTGANVTDGQGQGTITNDDGGCSAITITTPTVTQPTCATPTGTIVVNATGSGTLEYQLNGGTFQLSNMFSSLASGTYIITVRLQSTPACLSTYSGNPVVLTAATGCSTCTLTCPANIVVNNKPDYCGKNVNYPAATKTGTCGPLTYSKPSGSWFPVGTTTVTVTSASTGASCSFTVKVVDNQKPDINCPSNIVVNAANNSCSKVVNYSFSVTDNCSGVTVTSVPASGSVFNTGTTTVVITAKDASGNTRTSSFTVTVKENKAPVITCPLNITVNAAPGLCKALVNPGIATATDNCPGVITITGKRSDNKALNAYYPLGETTIIWKAKDASGNESTCQQKITVNDIQPPAITNVSVNPAVLWPADHSMKTVTVYYTSTDNCGVEDNCSYDCQLSVTSNEPVNGTGNGDLSPDWQIINDHKVKLRAERQANGTGRIYTIKITCTDGAGNSAAKTVTVSVPLTASADYRTIAPAAEIQIEKGISAGLTAQVMPNPTESEFNLFVKGGNNETVEIRVFDIIGRQVQQIRSAANNVVRFGNNLIQGIYIIEVRQGKEKVVLKAIKQ